MLVLAYEPEKVWTMGLHSVKMMAEYREGRKKLRMILSDGGDYETYTALEML